MLLGQVKTHVVSTAKLDGLVGKKLLLVEIATVGAGGLEPTGRHLVCVDTVGAGEGELVLVVMGNSSRVAPDMEDVPTDAVVVGIVDSLQAAGRALAPTAG
jgi:ethanolamine utilization protein EutN